MPEAQQTMLSEEKIPKEIEKKMKKEAKKKKISKKPKRPPQKKKEKRKRAKTVQGMPEKKTIMGKKKEPKEGAKMTDD